CARALSDGYYGGYFDYW
nr:immunoglobulin heavy chain junction region [Mus musculus]